MMSIELSRRQRMACDRDLVTPAEEYSLGHDFDEVGFMATFELAEQAYLF